MPPGAGPVNYFAADTAALTTAAMIAFRFVVVEDTFNPLTPQL